MSGQFVLNTNITHEHDDERDLVSATVDGPLFCGARYHAQGGSRNILTGP